MARARRRKHERQRTKDGALSGEDFGKVMDAIRIKGHMLADHATLPFRRQLTSYTFKELVFKPEALRALIAAAPMCSLSRGFETYNLHDGIYMQIGAWEANGILPPNVAQLKDPLPAEFKELIGTAFEVHNKLSRVEEVLCWMDANATTAAIRQWWPSILSLSPNCLGPAPASQRHAPPDGIGKITTLLRETQQIIAGWMIMPDPEEIPRLDLTLTLPETLIVSGTPDNPYVFKSPVRSFNF